MAAEKTEEFLNIIFDLAFDTETTSGRHHVHACVNECDCLCGTCRCILYWFKARCAWMHYAYKCRMCSTI